VASFAGKYGERVDDLIAFLSARLDEDEAAAKLAAREGGTWTQDDPERHPGSISSLGGQVVYDEGSPDEYQAPHIARHDPARVLREVEAMRAILAEAGRIAQSASMYPNQGNAAALIAMQTVLKILATGNSGHPDYRPEWKP
jgi:hypothetical protein